jgi:hypothetical protein
MRKLTQDEFDKLYDELYYVNYCAAFTGLNLSGLKFKGIDVTNNNFSGSDLRNCDFTGVFMSKSMEGMLIDEDYEEFLSRKFYSSKYCNLIGTFYYGDDGIKRDFLTNKRI